MTESTESPAEFWDRLYRGMDPDLPTRPNAVLADTVADLAPGAALDLGSGRGGDALWLAEQGWSVTALDVSGAAIDGLRVRSGALAHRITAHAVDLSEAQFDGEFDLVNAQYLQTPLPFARSEVLRRAAGHVRAGGLLLVVDHASVSPWSWNQHARKFPTPTAMFEDIGLDTDDWYIQRLEAADRTATGPGGQTATVTDNVIALRRRA